MYFSSPKEYDNAEHPVISPKPLDQSMKPAVGASGDGDPAHKPFDKDASANWCSLNRIGQSIEVDLVGTTRLFPDCPSTVQNAEFLRISVSAMTIMRSFRPLSRS
jgi:hypothetical protein